MAVHHPYCSQRSSCHGTDCNCTVPCIPFEGILNMVGFFPLTESKDGELFDFDAEVEPILDVLVARMHQTEQMCKYVELGSV